MDKQLQLLLWLAAAAVIVVICDARLTESATNQFLAAHNEARAAVGVGPLRWSNELAYYASQLVEHPLVAASCELPKQAASCQFGENQAVANLLDSPATVVGSWVDDGKLYFNYENNSCAAGHQQECNSYKQVVWRTTAYLGCGKGNCGKDGSHTVCLYSPRGNVPGERPF